jgi:hypothetical protein
MVTRPSAGPDHPDQVVRWADLRLAYPQASYALDGDGWFCGALRGGDDDLRRSDLGRLIGALLAREPGDGQ